MDVRFLPLVGNRAKEVEDDMPIDVTYGEELVKRMYLTCQGLALSKIEAPRTPKDVLKYLGDQINLIRRFLAHSTRLATLMKGSTIEFNALLLSAVDLSIHIDKEIAKTQICYDTIVKVIDNKETKQGYKRFATDRLPLLEHKFTMRIPKRRRK
jgi:hypothetical protein